MLVLMFDLLFVLFVVVEFVTLLSDPDNLNHLIVSQLDQVPSGNLLEVVHDPDRDTPSSNSRENNDV